MKIETLSDASLVAISNLLNKYSNNESSIVVNYDEIIPFLGNTCQEAFEQLIILENNLGTTISIEPDEENLILVATGELVKNIFRRNSNLYDVFNRSEDGKKYEDKFTSCKSIKDALRFCNRFDSEREFEDDDDYGTLNYKINFLLKIENPTKIKEYINSLIKQRMQSEDFAKLLKDEPKQREKLTSLEAEEEKLTPYDFDFHDGELTCKNEFIDRFEYGNFQYHVLEILTSTKEKLHENKIRDEIVKAFNKIGTDKEITLGKNSSVRGAVSGTDGINKKIEKKLGVYLIRIVNSLYWLEVHKPRKRVK